MNKYILLKDAKCTVRYQDKNKKLIKINGNLNYNIKNCNKKAIAFREPYFNSHFTLTYTHKGTFICKEHLDNYE